MDMYLYGLECRFQSTHPRGVRHKVSGPLCMAVAVSIHAPAWGATRSAGAVPPRARWFQSTHPRGVRPDLRGLFLRGHGGFNPRTRVGCDVHHWFTPTRLLWFQSTHPRGVRLAGYVTKKITKKFQSTHPRGVRQRDPRPVQCRGGFNPRTRVGCDFIQEALNKTFASFNPRTRVGCDLFERIRKLVDFFVSIHAPAWGATKRRVWTHRLMLVSIHAPAWGATHLADTKAVTAAKRFNPRTRVGCDGRRGRTVEQTDVSIHAPAWGATGDLPGLLRQPVVSIHAPAWGATSCRKSSIARKSCFNPRTRVGCDVSMFYPVDSRD